MNLVDEDDQVQVLLQFLEDSFEALLELAAVLRPRHDERQVEGEDLPVCQEERDAPLDDPLRETFHDGRLSDSRLAEENRVVLRPPGEDLDDPLDFLFAPDERVEGALVRQSRQVAGVLGQERELLLLLRRLPLLDEGDRLLPDPVEIEAVGDEDAARDARVDAEDPDEKVLRADVGMHHRLRLVRGVGEDLLRLLRERELLRRRDALHEDAVPLDLAPDVVGPDVEAGEDLLDDVLPLAQDAEKDVLGLDHLRAELRRLVAGEEEGPAGFLVVLLEHDLDEPVNPFGVNNFIVAQRFAHSGSCVTTTAAPARSLATSRRRSKTAAAWAVSRLPVGSSHRRRRGRRTTARAMATRCLSPPDRVRGKAPDLPESPTRPRTSRAVARASLPPRRRERAGARRSLRPSAREAGGGTGRRTRSPRRAARPARSGERLVHEEPATVTVPASGSSSPAKRWRSVDFPQPDGPVMARTSPGRTSRRDAAEDLHARLRRRRTPWRGPPPRAAARQRARSTSATGRRAAVRAGSAAAAIDQRTESATTARSSGASTRNGTWASE